MTPRDPPELAATRTTRKQIEAQLMAATEGKPRLWCSEPLLEWTPEKLPGYAEAVAKIERGESLFTKEQKPATTPRVRRSLDSLKEERERLTAQLDRLSGTYLPDDPGALSGIRRRRTGADTKRDQKTDADLQKAVKLRGRIDYLEHRILDLYAFMDKEGTTDGAPFLMWDTEGMLDMAAIARGIDRYAVSSLEFPAILVSA